MVYIRSLFSGLTVVLIIALSVSVPVNKAEARDTVLCLSRLCSLFSREEEYTDCQRTFEDCVGEARALSRASDVICRQNNLVGVACGTFIGALIREREANCKRNVRTCIEGATSTYESCVNFFCFTIRGGYNPF